MTDLEAGTVSLSAVPANGRASGSVAWFAAAGLVGYAVVLALWAGDFGFDGDDWWVLSWPYWHPFPASVLSYAREFLRPLEGLYWITAFECFGFNRVAFHFCSLLLLVLSSGLMGACLSKAFPERRGFVGLSVLLAFFLPTVSCLTYMVFTDNSRLSVLLFWASALAFQVWAERRRSWGGLIPPMILYLLSFLTYEAPSFLIFMVPFLVWPLYERRPGPSARREFVIRLSVGVVGGFAAAVAIRMLCLDGGAVGQSHLLPPVELIASYLALLPFYLVAPFTFMSEEPVAWVLGLMMAFWTAAILFIFSKGQGRRLPVNGHKAAEPVGMTVPGAMPGDEASESGLFTGQPMYPVLVGIGILLLGMLPYQMAGYGGTAPTLLSTVLAKSGLSPDLHPTWFNFNEASRIYSSASCGLAIAVAGGVTAWQGALGMWVGRTLTAMAVGLMVVFHAGLRTDWNEAARIRTAILADLVREVPAVKPNTNFVFFDLECYHKRAAVIRGWSGLRELIRMLYDDATLGAWYVYRSATEWPNSGRQQAFISPAGFVSRGMNMLSPAPRDSLLLLRRSGQHVSLLPRTDSKTRPYSDGICWRGAYTLHCNTKRIMRRLSPHSVTHGLFLRQRTVPLAARLRLNQSMAARR